VASLLSAVSTSAAEQQKLQMVPSTISEKISHASTNRKTFFPAPLKNGDLNNKLTAEQKRLLKNNIQNMILQDIYSHDEEDRKLAEGDWDFLDDFFNTFNFETTLGETFNVGGIAFTIETIKCDSFDISDIITDGSGTTTQYDLSFSVTGITLQCDLDYSYEGPWYVGSGSGTIGLKIDPQTSIETVLRFTSSNFDTDSPSGASLICNPNIDIEEVTFSNRVLDLFIAPFLPNAIESSIEPMICEPFEELEALLADTVMTFKDVIDANLEPIPPELTDKLYPETILFNDTSLPTNIDFLSLEPLVEAASPQISGFVNMISHAIFGMNNGTISIPIMMPLGTGAYLIEIRLFGLDDFDFDAISLLGNYTLTSTYDLAYIGLEIELGLQNDDGSTDIVLVTAGIEDVLFDFALLLVLEQSILDVGTMFTDTVADINGVITNITDVGSDVSDVAMDVIEILVNLGGAGTDLISVVTNISAIRADILNVVMNFTDILTNFTLTSDFTSIVTDINSVGSDITDVVTGITDILSSFAMGNNFSDFNFTDVITDINSFGTKIPDIVMDLTGFIDNFTAGTDFTDVVTDFNAIGTDITDVVIDVVDILQNFIIAANLTDVVMDITDISAEIISVVRDVTDIIEGVADLVECALNPPIYVVEVAGLSLRSGKLDGLEISGLSGFKGPQQLFNEVSDAIYFMYDDVLIDIVDSFFQLTLREAINGAIASFFLFGGTKSDACKVQMKHK